MRFLARSIWTAPFVVLSLIHCSTKEDLAAGAECFQAVECAQGLICAPVNGKRICTSDLTSVESPSGYDAAMREGGVQSDGATMYDAPPSDGSPPADTFVPPPPPPPPPPDAGNG